MDSSESGDPWHMLELVMDLLVYATAVLAGIAGALKGHPGLLALPVAVYVILALDPYHGRWRHVWQ